MSKVTWEVKGLDQVMLKFDEISAEIGDKKAKSNILIPAMREAMKPVLSMAKELAPKDTGALAMTQRVEARRPNKNDRRSKYVFTNDTVIAKVTTKPFPKKLKLQFNEENKDLSIAERRKKFRALAKSINFPYDARAMAQEFGTARNPAHPYLRPALEAQKETVVDNLGKILNRRIDEFQR